MPTINEEGPPTSAGVAKSLRTGTNTMMKAPRMPGADIGRSVGMKVALRAANTSFAVLIRTKSSSEFEVLVPGLTPGVAEALHQDIMEAMN